MTTANASSGRGESVPSVFFASAPLTKPQSVRILESVETARKRGCNVVTARKGAALTEREKEVVRIFVASSVKEFEVERGQIAEYFDTLNQAHERDGVRIVWYRPETMSRAYYEGGSQLPYNEEITKSRFFVLLIGRRLGEYTEAEFNLALKCCRESGKPVIIPYFLDVSGDLRVAEFKERLKTELKQYVNAYDNLDVILSHLHIELIRHGAFRREDAELSDREAAADKGLDGIRELIREQEKRIAELDAQTVTPLIIREKTAAYEEIKRLSQKYDMAPDSLLHYMWFLREQHLYDDGIELGHWLERFYTLHDPGKTVWARLQNRIGVCYHKSTCYEEAEQHYRKALEIYKRLAKVNPMQFEPGLAHSLNNLGELLNVTNRKKEAEQCHRKALEIRRRLTQDNVVFASSVAQSCDNLANLLSVTGRIEEAKQYYQEALDIFLCLSEIFPYVVQPDLAKAYNNLATLLHDTKQMDEAERNYQEALKIRRCLVESNPTAFEPDLASTCYNLGVFECDRGNRDAARGYFEEALSIDDKYPHLAKNAENDRYQLSLL